MEGIIEPKEPRCEYHIIELHSGHIELHRLASAKAPFLKLRSSHPNNHSEGRDGLIAEFSGIMADIRDGRRNIDGHVVLQKWSI